MSSQTAGASARPAKRAPQPEPGSLNAEFYARAARGRLELQRCSACGVFRHPPRFLCAKCGAPEFGWQPVSGLGEVFSWTVTHRVLDPAWGPDPYATLVVQLEEGPRVLGVLRGLEPSQLRLGLPVALEIEPSGGAAFFYFRPREN
jgi:uncharacterized OB-fold protein